MYSKFLLAGQMILEDARNYTFMTKGAVRVPGIEDVEEFQMTIQSMKVMGISDEDMNSIWRVISASLLFGNMEFKQERNSDQATLPDNTVAQKVRQCNTLNILHSVNRCEHQFFAGCSLAGNPSDGLDQGLPEAQNQGWQGLCDQGPDKRASGVCH